MDAEKDKKVAVEAPKLEKPSEWFEFEVEMKSYLMKIHGLYKVLLRYVIRDDNKMDEICAVTSNWDTFPWTGARHSGFSTKWIMHLHLRYFALLLTASPSKRLPRRKRWLYARMVQRFGCIGGEV